MFAYLVDTYGAVELDQVHRFRNHWERTASLRLRAGDPGVLTEYERHGRLHAGTPEHMDADPSPPGSRLVAAAKPLL